MHATTRSIETQILDTEVARMVRGGKQTGDTT